MIEYTYNDNDDVNRKPINNTIDYGEQRLTLYAKLEWSLKKYWVDNIKFDQKKELKRYDHTDANKQDQLNWMPDPRDHLDSISSIPDLYSNKQRIQPNHHDYSKQDLNQDLLKRTHSPQGMLSLIDPTGYCVMEKKDGECPDPEVKLYYRGAHRQRYLGKPLGEMDYVWGENESMS